MIVDEEVEDPIKKAERQFYEVIEAERRKRERENLKKLQEDPDCDEKEKQDHGKVRNVRFLEYRHNCCYI